MNVSIAAEPGAAAATMTRRIQVGVWASRVAAVMLIGIAVFWVVSPRAASEGAFGIVADSEAAIAYAQLTAIFKAVGDVVAPLFALVTIYHRQWHVTGVLNLLTLFLIPGVDIVVWGTFAGPSHILMHAPFAVPIAVGAYCLFGQGESS